SDATARTDASRSQAESSPGAGVERSRSPQSREATGAPRHAGDRDPSPPSAMRRQQPRAAALVSAVDTALEELAAPVVGSAAALPVEPTPVPDRDASQAHSLLEVAAASLAVALTWDRALAATGSRRKARLDARPRWVGNPSR